MLQNFNEELVKQAVKGAFKNEDDLERLNLPLHRDDLVWILRGQARHDEAQRLHDGPDFVLIRVGKVGKVEGVSFGVYQGTGPLMYLNIDIPA